MKRTYLIPSSVAEAEAQLAVGGTAALNKLPKEDFVARWCAIAYLEPGLHPDGFDCPDSGWPGSLRAYAAEAWRRSDLGELRDEEMYCSDAAWAGLYDRMHTHTADEIERRLRIAMGKW